MPREPATVYIIDDDAAVRQALGRLLRAAGLRAVPLSAVEDLLDCPDAATSACVIADIRMPGVSGLNLPSLLKDRGWDMQVIFLTAQDTDLTRAEAKQAGAAGFFRKPVDDQALIDAIHWALRDDPPPPNQGSRAGGY